MKTATKAIIGFLLFSLCHVSMAEILITPSQPTPTDTVQIQLVNQYTSAAEIASENITRNGQQFIIMRTVDVVCMLPSAPILTSTFDVGVLGPGVYEVIAETVHTSTLPGCDVAPLSENTSFGIGGIVAVPTVSAIGSAILICLLFLFGRLTLKINRHHQ